MHTLTTYTLRRDDTQALLTVQTREQQQGGEWNVGAVGEWLGRITENGKQVTFTPDVHPGRADGPTLSCKRTTLKAAAAVAVRTPTGGADECGDEGRRVPAKTRAIEALHCSADPHDWSQIALAPAPGIEWLHVNDDCSMQGGGWRLIAPSFAIAKIRK